MSFSGNNKSIVLSSALLACSIFLFVIALAYFDNQASEILKGDHSDKSLIAIWIFPVLIIAAFFYRLLKYRSAPSRRLIVSVIVGIPVSLLATISLLMYLH